MTERSTTEPVKTGDLLTGRNHIWPRGVAGSTRIAPSVRPGAEQHSAVPLGTRGPKIGHRCIMPVLGSRPRGTVESRYRSDHTGCRVRPLQEERGGRLVQECAVGTRALAGTRVRA